MTQDANDTFDVFLHNDDSISFDYAILVLTKVFDQSKEQARATAELIDKNGGAVVFTGSKDKADAKLTLLDPYNQVNDARLMAEVVAQGTKVTPVDTSVITTGLSVTAQLVDRQLDEDQMIFFLKGLGAQSAQTANQWANDLLKGREILVADFGADPLASVKAEVLLNSINHRLGFDDPDNEPAQAAAQNITLSVRPAQHTLGGNKPLTSWKEIEDKKFLNVIGDFGNDIVDMYQKTIEQEYGSVANFLSTAPQEKIDEYNEIMKGIDEISEMTGAKKLKV